MAVEPKPRKQAVVIVHGMGEQRPLATLRSFVEAVWATDASQTVRQRMEKSDKAETRKDAVEPNQYWIAPDSRAGSYELRRITTPANDSNLRTDFYEFYWADIMAGSKPGHLWGWMMGLLFRNPKTVPDHALTLWYALWVVFGLFIVTALSVASIVAGPSLLKDAANGVGLLFRALFTLAIVLSAVALGIILGKWFETTRGMLTSFIVIVLAVALFSLAQPCCNAEIEFFSKASPVLWTIPGWIVLLTLIYVFALPYFGDVARYVRASPANVEKRQAVRQRGLELLNRLHESKEYERIILVSHSLGTVIAYDLLTIFWADHGPSSRHAMSAESSRLFAEIDAIACQGFGRKVRGEEVTPKARPADLLKLRDKQRALSRSLAAEKEPWLISDLITLGSPLTHSEFLVAESDEAFEKLRKDRIISICPPAVEAPHGGTGEAPRSMLYEARARSGKAMMVPHHAAVFSCVRWTNIYDQPSCIIFGDFVSGSLRRLFDWGVKDVKVRIVTSRIPVLRRIFTHTSYWTNFAPDRVDRHIAELRSAVDLLDCASPMAADPPKPKGRARK